MKKPKKQSYLNRKAGIIGGGVVLATMLLVSLVYAASNPGFLNQNISNIAAGNHSYRVWYTDTCNGGADCECDNQPDTDLDNDNTLEDSDDDCIATIDTDGDNVFDDAPDHDNDGVFNVMDQDWTQRGGGVTESVPNSVVDSVQRYVNDWNMQDPAWGTDQNRDVYVWNLPGNLLGNPERYDAEAQIRGPRLGRATVLHEFWHKEQTAYNADYSDGAPSWWVEGQAAFMEDKVFNDLDHMNNTIYDRRMAIYLRNTVGLKRQDRDNDGNNEFAQSYGLLDWKHRYNSGLWWTYLADQAGNQFQNTTAEGVDIAITALENADNDNRQGKDVVDSLLRDRIGQGFDDTFWDFTIANYAKDFDVTELDHRYVNGRDPEVVLQYRDEERGSANPEPYRGVSRTNIDNNNLLNGSSGSLNALNTTISATNTMPDYGVQYYEAGLNTVSECPLVYWQVDAHESDARFLHSWMAVQADSNGDGAEEIVSVSRSEGGDFNRALWQGYQEPGTPDYTRATAVIAATDTPYGYDWEMGCAYPSVDIVSPTTDDPAFVGFPDDPGRFLLWVQVEDTAGNIDFVEGLEWRRDFTVTVGADNAPILNGGYVQNQYWLVVDAPQKPGANVGDKFDVKVELGPNRVPDTEAEAIVYDSTVTDQVLVIDRSGSMNGDPYPTKLDSAKSAARLFSDVKLEDDWLGVVSFSNNAIQEFALTLIPDQDDSAGVRANAQDAIDGIMSADQTSIGDGLIMAQQMISNTGNLNHQWAMVLLSDGKENEPQYWYQVRPDIVGAGTEVHAIALGTNADESLMRQIAQETCGSVWQDHCYNYVSTNSSALQATQPAQRLSSLPNRLADAYRRIEENIAGQQRLWQENGSFNGAHTTQVVIEEGGARDAFFSFHWDNPDANVNVTINGGGVSFIPLGDNRTHMTFYADQLPPDTYNIEITAEESINWIGSLAGRLVSGAELHAYIDNFGLEERRPGLPVRIEASLTDDGGPVRGADVSAAVLRPDGETETVTLVDDGGPYDDEANDGVYSYVYDRINRPLEVFNPNEHTWIVDIHATGENNAGEAFDRYDRLTYSPRLNIEFPHDSEPDGMIDYWEDRFAAVDSNVVDDGEDPDNDGLTNKEEHELGTNPEDADTDNGGETDGSEVNAGRDPLYTADDQIPPLGGFWPHIYSGHTHTETAPSNTVMLHFPPNDQYQSIRLYRATGSIAGGFTMVGDFSPTSGTIVDNGLTNGQSYFYYIQPVGASGVMGAPSKLVYAKPSNDPVNPHGFVTINDGAELTHNKNVSLTLSAAEDTVAMQVSDDPDMEGVPWQPYQYQMNWTLDPNPDTGEAAVFVRYLDDNGNESEIFGGGIQYDPPLLFPGLVDLSWLQVDLSPYEVTITPLPYSALGLGDGDDSGMQAAAPTQDEVEPYYANVAFRLEARDDQGDPVTEFDEPFTITFHYEEWEWQSTGISDESTLNLYQKRNGVWQPLLPCAGCSHDTEENVIVAASDHLSDFALLGEPGAQQSAIYIPLIIRN